MRPRIPVLLLAVQCLAACSAEQGYLSAQGWQRNQCLQLPDKAQADRCMSNGSTNTSYDSYKQQTEPRR